jgi:hypothetical protein
MTYTITDKALFAVVNGQPYSLTADHAAFEQIKTALLEKASANKVEAMFNKALGAMKFMAGSVAIDGGELLFNGKPVHGVVVDRILAFKAQGMPYQPLVEFLKRLQNNPSRHSVNELYNFIEKNKLPITEDGFVLGYKGVNYDWTDVYTSTIDNSIGAIPPRFERNQADDNWRQACSSGYHVGSKDYVTGYGSRTVIVKVDPADAVSVPEDAWKMRVVGYEVVAEYNGELPAVVANGREPYQKASMVKAFLKLLFGPAN